MAELSPEEKDDAIFNALAGGKRLSKIEIAERTGISKERVRTTLGRLKDSGKVARRQRDGAGNTIEYYQSLSPRDLLRSRWLPGELSLPVAGSRP